MDYLDENTTDTNTNSSDEEYNWDFYYDVYDYTNLFIIFLTLMTVVCGLTSWILIQKWRTFRNYVLINVSAASFLKHLMEQVYDTDTISHDAFIILYTVAIFAYNLWLLVLCALFYSTIVKVFKPPVHGRTWKSALLAWGGATILGAIDFINLYYEYSYYDFVIFVLPFLINLVTFVMYMIVLWSLLMRRSEIRSSNSNIGAKVQMATLLFLMSGVASLACHIIDTVTRTRSWLTLVAENADLFPSIVVAIWVFAAKSNRTLWYDYYRNRLRNSVNIAIIDMV